MIVQCPRCKNKMKYYPKPGLVTKKSKQCVYCGKTFKIHTNPQKSAIISEK